MRFSHALAIFLFLAGFLFAADPTGNVTTSLSELCIGLTSLLPVAAMLMVLVGAVTYAAGQLMGAETRARANVWATAALTGAMMGLLITAVAPPLLQAAYGSAIYCASVDCGPLPAGQKCCRFGDSARACLESHGCNYQNKNCEWVSGAGDNCGTASEIGPC